MTQTQAEALAVTGKGSRKSDGATVYTVTSSSQPGRWYLVAVMGTRLSCDCQAGKRGLICQHRALVRERIEMERQAERIAAAVAGLPATRETRPAHPGDTALLRRNNRPFSILA